MMARLIARIQDIPDLLATARRDPESAIPQLKVLAASKVWQTREVAATALVEIGKRHPATLLKISRSWAKSADPNIRRAASEGLRGIVKIDPESVRPVLNMLKADRDLYVKKSVANVLRNASSKHPDFVLGIVREWMSSSDPNTHWIVKDGLRKLKISHPREVGAVLTQLQT